MKPVGLKHISRQLSKFSHPPGSRAQNKETAEIWRNSRSQRIMPGQDSNGSKPSLAVQAQIRMGSRKLAAR